MKYLFATVSILGLLASGAAHAANSAVENALAGDSDLSLFHQALLNTGVANELNDRTEYTVFAPTNAAFAKIQPNAYPCFYATTCRDQLAAILRNHIVPRNESVSRFAVWGGGIPTLGERSLDVEEPYKGQYKVEGRVILDHDESNRPERVEGDGVSLYRIDGVIATRDELAQFRVQPVAVIPGTVVQKTVTTYRTPAVTHVVTYPNGYPVAGGYAAPGAVYLGPQDGATETTTVVTHTAE